MQRYKCSGCKINIKSVQFQFKIDDLGFGLKSLLVSNLSGCPTLDYTRGVISVAASPDLSVKTD